MKLWNIKNQKKETQKTTNDMLPKDKNKKNKKI